ncbi:MAG: DUF4129 domain-containing protein [Planctomycetes bacterium]|nr:DUF4129 domain-containing protein [Planctomycetota bacterium]
MASRTLDLRHTWVTLAEVLLGFAVALTLGVLLAALIAIAPVWSRRLVARGCPKPMHRPPLTHVDIIKDANPDLAGGAERLVSLFYRARFGRRPISADEHRAAIRLVSQLEPDADIEPHVREVARL